MKWSWKLGEVAGIGIFVHWTFLLLIGYIVFVRFQMGDDTAGVIESIAIVLAVFGCVVLHELGHALTAKRYGVRTRDITLLPIGGVARLERIPEDPVQEFWIAVAGPAVNVAIAALLFVVLLLWQGPEFFTQERVEQEVYTGDFLVTLLGLNIMLVLFNLLPAFPMDGGRVLRAALAHFTGDYVRATQTAASVGQVMAILFGLLGLFGGNFGCCSSRYLSIWVLRRKRTPCRSARSFEACRSAKL
jgi:Zn-dependent protease